MKNYNELRQEIKELTQKAYNLKTKKAKEKVWDKISVLERECLTLNYKIVDSIYGLEVEVEVRYDLRGKRGLAKIISPEKLSGHFVQLNPSSDVLSKSWYANTCCIEYKKDQVVKGIIKATAHVDGISLFLTKIQGGILNEEQYAELDKRDDLAFFKHSNRDGITGLFK